MTDLGMPRVGAPDQKRTAGVKPAFDDHRPPDAALAGDCVHCGFCLPTCPTYVLWGQEMDSPRGRIDLMTQGLAGEPMTGSMVQHWDACLGCMACVTACPSGVQYDKLIEATRGQVERHHRRSLPDRALRGLIFALFPHRERLRAVSGPLKVYQRLGMGRLVRRTGLLERFVPQLAAMEALAPPLGKRTDLPELIPAQGEERATVGMLTGCVQGEFFPDVNAATARVLSAEGCEVVVPRSQGCCGALSAHHGREDEAMRYARSVIDVFEGAGVDHVVVNSAGCGSTMKEYADLLRDDEAYRDRAQRFAGAVLDVAELLVELGPVAPRHRLDVTVAYHDACHLAHAQGVTSQPRQLLRGIPGVELREVPEGEICCGSAGIYNILFPRPARELGDRKAANIASTGAALLVTANPGCLMQVASGLERAGADLGMAHTVQVLDASIRDLGVEPLLR